jgi:hypothetical protein
MATFCAVSLMALNPAGAAAPEIHVLDF